MGNKIALKANIRERTGKNLPSLRSEGLIPGVVYGNKIVNILVSVDEKIFGKVFKEAGENTLVELEIGKEKPRTVLIQDVTVDSVRQKLVHVDFYQVRLDQAVKTEVPLVFEGVSKAVKDLNGTLVKLFQSLELESLPADILSEITVDISKLDSFDDKILVKDLNIGSSAKFSADLEEVVAMVSQPRTEQEIEGLGEDVVEDVDSVEGVEKDEEPKDESASVTKKEKAAPSEKE